MNGCARAQIGIDTQSPFTDDRPLQTPGQAETREYRVRHWDKGAPSGNFTPVVKVAVGA